MKNINEVTPMECSTTISKKRVNRFLDLIFKMQNSIIESNESGDFIFLRDIKSPLSSFITSNYSTDELDGVDLDLSVIDSIFTEHTISSHSYLLFNTSIINDLTKSNIVDYIYNLENLLNLINKDLHAALQEDNKKESSAKSGEVILSDEDGEDIKDNSLPSVTNNSMMSADVVEQYMFNEVMNSFSHNPLVTITLMQKKQEGRLTKENLMKIVSAMGSMGGMSSRGNPMSMMMVMNVLEQI